MIYKNIFYLIRKKFRSFRTEGYYYKQTGWRARRTVIKTIS